MALQKRGEGERQKKREVLPGKRRMRKMGVLCTYTHTYTASKEGRRKEVGGKKNHSVLSTQRGGQEKET